MFFLRCFNNTGNINPIYVSKVQFCLLITALEVNSLTVDWVSKLVYWTDAQTQIISVVDYNGDHRTILVYTGLQNPRGIVADPVNG